MTDMHISKDIIYIGVDDTAIDLFESQYPVPDGVSYNSYLILDEKIAVMDTVDPHYTHEWMENLDRALDGRKPSYLIVQHMEPDHSGAFRAFLLRYPQTIVAAGKKAFPMIEQFTGLKLSPEQMLIVGEGDTLCLGRHTLQFMMAPFVHWPEVMVTYEQTEQLLFSADAFGTFGALSSDPDWNTDARRYYINIVGKYGAQVQTLLKKAADLPLSMICPLHGPILRDPLDPYISKYQIWSSYEPEEPGVTIVCASLHGNTLQSARRLAGLLNEKGVGQVALFDLNRDDLSEAVASAYRYDRLVLASVTYDGALFPAMEDFLYHLKIKNYQNRTVGYIQNGTWAPAAAKYMKAEIAEMKNMTEVEPVVTIRSTLNDASYAEMQALADALVK